MSEMLCSGEEPAFTNFCKDEDAGSPRSRAKPPLGFYPLASKQMRQGKWNISAFFVVPWNGR
ncbi:hypothetical protein PLANPX_0065 [Lacipirellula parvula]|uniref:Uncharacterized protein n=1 Tax=Lacipirellula parvula TaxID=2650471 RepID=A0A5K7X7L3_9BACT|nr:hypothetical protein PLANPX_0065 [Lacipirellula parvula]